MTFVVFAVQGDPKSAQWAKKLKIRQTIQTTKSDAQYGSGYCLTEADMIDYDLKMGWILEEELRRSFGHL